MSVLNSNVYAIPFNDLTNGQTTQEYKEIFERVFNSGRFILGPEVERFENAWANYCWTKHCVSVANGTEAITLALHAIGIGQGDLVLTVGNSAPPTVTAIRRAGCLIRYTEIDDNGLMDLEYIRTNPDILSNVKAVVPVDLYGKRINAHSLQDIIKGTGIVIIEDAAQAHGSMSSSRAPGADVYAACFSFYPTKNLGCFGDGGAIVTNDSDLAFKLRSLRHYGLVSFYQNTHGFNSRLDELQAAFLTHKLSFLDRSNHFRLQVAKLYCELLNDLDVITLPNISVEDNCHLFTIKVADREALRNHLTKKGIQTAVHYPIPSYLQKSEIELSGVRFQLKKTEKHCRTIMSLPMWYGISDDSVKLVAKEIKNFYGV